MYPRFQNNSFVHNDWVIMVNPKTVVIELLFAKEVGFRSKAWMVSIRALVSDRTQRKMLTGTHNLLKNNTYIDLNYFCIFLINVPDLISRIKEAQKEDSEIWTIVENLDKQVEFRVDDDNVLWHDTRLVVPNDISLREALLTEAHSSPFSVHPGSTKMYHDLKQYFWWSGMKRDLDIPVWKWDEIYMDFVTSLPPTQRRHDAIWVVVDRLTKSAHFLPIRKDFSVSRLAEIFQQEIVRLHGTPSAIVSDRDPRFASRFWKGLQKAWGTRLNPGPNIPLRPNLGVLHKVLKGFESPSLQGRVNSPGSSIFQVKKRQEKDKIGSKPNKNGKRGEAEKSQKQLQSIEKEKLKKHDFHSFLRFDFLFFAFLVTRLALVPVNYESETGYNENYNSYPYDSSSLPQQYPCCTRCGGPHETCQCDQLIFDEPYYKHCGGPHMNYQCQPMNQDSYNSNSLIFDQLQPQPPQSPVIHQPPQELSIQEMEDLKQQYLDELKRLSNLEYRDEIKIAELTENFNGMSIEIQKKEKLLQQEQWAYLSTHPSKRLHFFCFDDDEEDFTFSITPDEPVLSTEEPDNSLSMGDEHLDTIPATESDEFIKSNVENLITILSESEGIPDHRCDVPFHDNSPPLAVLKYQFEDLSESNEEFSSTDDDSFPFDKIDYVEASPPDYELVSSEVMEIVILEVGWIKASNDNPILFYDPIISGTPPNLTPSGESNFFLEGDMLLLEAFLNDDHSSDFKTKSSSTSLNSLLDETNNFNNSLPEFTTFSNVLFDAKYESDSSDDQSCSDEDVLEKIILKPLSEEEIIPMKSLRTHDSSLPISSKIDSLLDEFTGELTLLKSIPPGIGETDCDFEEDIRLIEKLFESFSPSLILVKDSDSLMEEIDLFCTPDYPMPPGIEDKDYDSERDILIRKDLPRNNTLSFVEKESFHFDIPPFSHPPAKPPDGDTGILNIKMMGSLLRKACSHWRDLRSELLIERYEFWKSAVEKSNNLELFMLLGFQTVLVNVACFENSSNSTVYLVMPMEISAASIC
nr:putative reverse transcriptase domain-containing protein [Tanacetum cinerariifolium]